MNPTMNRNLALVLQAGVVLIGLAVFVFLLGEPHLEGRNAHATLFAIYFHDPFLAYVYVGSVPGFVALYRAFGLLSQARGSGCGMWGQAEGAGAFGLWRSGVRG